jgi:hypothetical protein
MPRETRKITEAEAQELERLCLASFKRKLTQAENERVLVLQGVDPENAAFYAANGGGRPRSRVIRE